MKIFGIEGNYNTAACTRQGDETGADAPVLFTKCDTALLKDSKPFFIPDHLGTITAAVHLVVRICRLGKTIAPRFATRYYDAVTLGVDFTATDLQKNLQKAGQPWDLSKSFDGSAAIGTWVSLDELNPVHNLPLTLSPTSGLFGRHAPQHRRPHCLHQPVFHPQNRRPPLHRSPRFAQHRPHQ